MNIKPLAMCCLFSFFQLSAHATDIAESAESADNSAFSNLTIDSVFNTPHFYVESNLEFALLHELAHAIIELNNIPVLGGREKAADQIATMFMMLNSRDVEDDLLDQMISISAEWMIEWQQEVEHSSIAFWDVHPLSIQRFYDVTCLMYGAAVDKLERIRKEAWLPYQRAWDCDIEFQQNRETLSWLADNYSYVTFDENWHPVPKVNASAVHPKVNVQYITPSRPAHKTILEWLQSSERVAYILGRVNEAIKLPKPVTIYFESQCSGPDAWWNPKIDGIIVCYELIEQFEQNKKRLKPLINKLKGEANQSHLFLFPSKYETLISKQKGVLRERFIQMMDQMLEQNKDAQSK
ncbi:DUF4344 domain-containing metallopeptidase [Thalassotalea euphylliae]|uniref:Metallopeptidase n=1 Tax=Thalassotalea euphylliae TaxID=1655234 RepID=A0A3E0UHK5_9GAMM|nr:DUF4344 domain-containing metallopeptidase [Thalassotalea euphylliae]REL36346.1 hypothetical protein DXX92_14050 [Thalassotalea euphylliae]